MNGVQPATCGGKVNHFLDQVPTPVKVTAVVLGLLALAAVVTLYKTNQISLQVAEYAGAASGLVLIVGLIALNSIRDLCCRTQQDQPEDDSFRPVAFGEPTAFANSGLGGQTPTRIPARTRAASVVPPAQQKIQDYIAGGELPEAFAAAQALSSYRDIDKDALLLQIVTAYVERDQLQDASTVAGQISSRGDAKDLAYKQIANRHLQAGNLADAQDVIGKISSSGNTRDDLYVRLANMHLQAGNLADAQVRADNLANAQTVIGKISSSGNTRDDLYVRLANMHLQAGNLADAQVRADNLANAQTVIGKISSSGNTRDDLYVRLANMHLRAGNLADAQVRADNLANAQTVIEKISNFGNKRDPLYEKIVVYHLENKDFDSALTVALKIFNSTMRDPHLQKICSHYLSPGSTDLDKARRAVDKLASVSVQFRFYGQLCVGYQATNNQEAIQGIFRNILMYEFSDKRLRDGKSFEAPSQETIDAINAKAKELATDLAPLLTAGQGSEAVGQVKAAFSTITF